MYITAGEQNASPQLYSWITDSRNCRRHFDVAYFLSNVWIDRPLMASSDVSTRKPDGAFDWLIIQTFV